MHLMILFIWMRDGCLFSPAVMSVWRIENMNLLRIFRYNRINDSLYFVLYSVKEILQCLQRICGQLIIHSTHIVELVCNPCILHTEKMWMCMWNSRRRKRVGGTLTSHNTYSIHADIFSLLTKIFFSNAFYRFESCIVYVFHTFSAVTKRNLCNIPIRCAWCRFKYSEYVVSHSKCIKNLFFFCLFW